MYIHKNVYAVKSVESVSTKSIKKYELKNEKAGISWRI